MKPKDAFVSDRPKAAFRQRLPDALEEGHCPRKQAHEPSSTSQIVDRQRDELGAEFLHRDCSCRNSLTIPIQTLAVSRCRI